MNVNYKWWNKMRSIIVFNSCKGGDNDLNNRWETCGIKIAFQLYTSTDI